LEPRAWIKSVTFSDGTTLLLAKDDVVVVVGPNNSGKSASLRGIRDKFGSPQAASVVIKEISVEKEGSYDELIAWLELATKRIDQPNSDHTYQAFGTSVHLSQAKAIWPQPHSQIGQLARFFCHLLTADERLLAANPPGNLAITRDAPQHPIHFLQRDDALEMKLSNQFQSAFGSELVVHRNAGNQVPIHVGERPTVKPGQDRVSYDYVLELEKLPTIHTQGDGMRSFAGVLLYTAVGRQTVLLIDEPEAFLHPPQARHLGQMMVLDRKADRQLFIATHSGDVLRGILNSNSPNVRVVRLRRSGDVNIARELDNSQIAQLWNDPLLRYSSILDGLFHEKVVVCESDSDCRFYAAVMDAHFETKGEVSRRPDIMFTHCGGKGRLPLVIKSLRELEVPLAVVADFDVLSDEHPLREIVEATGGQWSDFEQDWKVVKNAVDALKPELNSSEIAKEITTILASAQEPMFPPAAKKKIQSILRRSSPWSKAKSVGIQYVPNGQPSQACERLLGALRARGVFVVPVGELEGFSKTASGHGPAWVNEVLKKNLGNDPELEAARNFVGTVVEVAKL
jgi:AAA domain, putative AbiEii toxin, Type IV TA system